MLQLNQKKKYMVQSLITPYGYSVKQFFIYYINLVSEFLLNSMVQLIFYLILWYNFVITPYGYSIFYLILWYNFVITPYGYSVKQFFI